MPDRKSRYIPALDGLRAFAVLAVIAYHMHMPWASGGLLGVTVFFVLSGYLITSLLLIEFNNTGKINLLQFWARRIRRLVPAIIFVIVCTIVLCTLFNHALLTKMRPDIAPSLLFFNNWWQIFHDVSYFDALGSPSPLAHFWSLAIEEQFYLIWPVILFVLLKFGVKKGALRNATLVLAGLSALEMALMFSPTVDPSRMYYGTDTRAFSLLIGAWLAFVWPSHMLGAKRGVRLNKQVRTILDGVGALALVGLLILVGATNGFTPFLYQGGLLLCSMLTAVVIAVIVHPASLLGRLAGTKPLVWIGKRSYGIYLWHYPLLLLMNPNAALQTPWWLYLIQLVVIFACAAFSYRFVEDPIRHGALETFLSRIKDGLVSFPEWLQTHAIPSFIAGVFILIALGGIILVPPTSALEGANILKEAEANQEDPPPIDTVAETERPKLDVLMIGDSVSVRAIPFFDELFPHGNIDATVNRQLYVGQDVYDAYKKQNVVGDLVVFALGTNGVATAQMVNELIADVGSDKQIWLINTRSPQDWVEITNSALEEAAARYSNVHLIDWHSASANHEEFFDGDGTHLTEEGARFYVDMIHQALASQLPTHPEDTAPPVEEVTPEQPVDETVIDAAT